MRITLLTNVFVAGHGPRDPSSPYIARLARKSRPQGTFQSHQLSPVPLSALPFTAKLIERRNLQARDCGFKTRFRGTSARARKAPTAKQGARADSHSSVCQSQKNEQCLHRRPRALEPIWGVTLRVRTTYALAHVVRSLPASWSHISLNYQKNAGPNVCPKTAWSSPILRLLTIKLGY